MWKTAHYIVACIGTILLFSGCGNDAPAFASSTYTPQPKRSTLDVVDIQRPTKRLPVIIDTDMGIDDWLAILYLAQHPRVDIIGVGVTGTGAAHCAAGVQNALGLLALAGLEERDIPVYCGREEPLVGTNAFPNALRSVSDSLLGLTLPPTDQQPLEDPAVEVLPELLEQARPRPILVALGPLTNLGEIITVDPSVADHVRSITAMGGAVHVDGNLIIPGVTDTIENVLANGLTDLSIVENSSAEWNVYADPVAAKRTLDAAWPVSLVPLDATNVLHVTDATVNCLAERQTNPVATFVYDVLATTQALIPGQFYLWDPMAAVISTEPRGSSCSSWQCIKLDVVTEVGEQQGSLVQSQHGAPTNVCVAGDRNHFLDRFFRVITRVPDFSRCEQERR